MMGDSRTSNPPANWPATLAAGMGSSTNSPWGYDNLGFAGSTVASALSGISADLSRIAQPNSVMAVLMNWGFNDPINFVAGGAPVEQWVADYESIIDQAAAVLPNAKFYLMRPSNGGTPGGIAGKFIAMHAVIDRIVAERPGLAFTGPDEKVWMVGADFGLTMTYDDVHYSAAGNAECAAQWQTALGH